MLMVSVSGTAVKL
jgi:Raf kinase inhibitor-like YbhB/YbcL family protein